MIYFDNSATTKIDPSVLKTYQAVSEQYYGNPSSLHNLGNQADEVLQQSRSQIASLIGAKPNEIYFTSGGTEGDNWVIKGTAIEKRPFGNHLITSSIEHPAVLNTMKQLEKLGFEVTYLPVDHHGFIDPEDLKKAIRKETILVSIMAVNNEVGSIQPLDEVAKILEDYPTIHFHVDAVQSIGKGLQDLIRNPRIDFLTFSGHKFHAPRGTGFIYAKSGRTIAPLLTGGGQESNLRSGTENVPAIAAMSRALRLVLDDESKKVTRQRKIRSMIYDHVAKMPKVTMFSEENDHFAPHILCFAIAGVRGETIVHAFEDQGIYISTTSACSSKNSTEANTLREMHVDQAIATSAVRVSLDENNTIEEANQFNEIFDGIYHRFEKINSTN